MENMHCAKSDPKIAHYHGVNFIFKNKLIDIKSNYRIFFNSESYLIKNHQVLYDLVDSKHPIFFATNQQIENSFDKLFSKYTLKSQSFYLLNQYLFQIFVFL